jgi:hypothetical protein
MKWPSVNVSEGQSIRVASAAGSTARSSPAAFSGRENAKRKRASCGVRVTPAYRPPAWRGCLETGATTLARHYPAIAEERYDELTKQGSAYGPDGVKAQALLTDRGLTPEIIGNVCEMLEELCRTEQSDSEMSSEEARAEAAKAEDAMWAWYLEWSQFVRSAITNRRLLRQLGFLSSSGSSVDEPATQGSAATTPAATGAAAPAATMVSH